MAIGGGGHVERCDVLLGFGGATTMSHGVLAQSIQPPDL
jgi:hypothetical protein